MVTKSGEKSPKTHFANALSRSPKKIDFFTMVALLIATLAYAVFVITTIELIRQKISINYWLEINGTDFATSGALWTALGVRLTKGEHDALLLMIKNTKYEIKELIDILNVASKFATQGAVLISIGGIMLASKIMCY